MSANDIAQQFLDGLRNFGSAVAQTMAAAGRQPAPRDDPHGIEHYGEITPAFRRGMEDAYGRLPQQTRQFLAENDAKVAVGGYADQVRPEGRDEKWTPTQDDQRVHQNQTGGLYDPQTNRAMVTQLRLDAHTLPPEGNAADYPTSVWQQRSVEDGKKVLRHEVGHSVDRNAGDLSQLAGFREAYDRDVAALGGPDAARVKGYGYYIQGGTGTSGRKEVFAEVWANQQGGGIRGADIEQAFPHSAAWVRNYQNRFEVAYRAGPQAVNELQLSVRTPAEGNQFLENKFFPKDQPITRERIQNVISQVGVERTAAYADYLVSDGHNNHADFLIAANSEVAHRTLDLVAARIAAAPRPDVSGILTYNETYDVFHRAVGPNNNFIDQKAIEATVRELDVERSAQFARDLYSHSDYSNSLDRCLAARIAQAPGVGERIPNSWAHGDDFDRNRFPDREQHEANLVWGRNRDTQLRQSVENRLRESSIAYMEVSVYRGQTDVRTADGTDHVRISEALGIPKDAWGVRSRVNDGITTTEIPYRTAMNALPSTVAEAPSGQSRAVPASATDERRSGAPNAVPRGPNAVSGGAAVGLSVWSLSHIFQDQGPQTPLQNVETGANTGSAIANLADGVVSIGRGIVQNPVAALEAAAPYVRRAGLIGAAAASGVGVVDGAVNGDVKKVVTSAGVIPMAMAGAEGGAALGAAIAGPYGAVALGIVGGVGGAMGFEHLMNVQVRPIQLTEQQKAFFDFVDGLPHGADASMSPELRSLVEAKAGIADAQKNLDRATATIPPTNPDVARRALETAENSFTERFDELQRNGSMPQVVAELTARNHPELLRNQNATAGHTDESSTDPTPRVRNNTRPPQRAMQDSAPTLPDARPTANPVSVTNTAPPTTRPSTPAF